MVRFNVGLLRLWDREPAGSVEDRREPGLVGGHLVEKPLDLEEMGFLSSKYGINDFRLFFENDLRFLKQF